MALAVFASGLNLSHDILLATDKNLVRGLIYGRRSVGTRSRADGSGKAITDRGVWKSGKMLFYAVSGLFDKFLVQGGA